MTPVPRPVLPGNVAPRPAIPAATTVRSTPAPAPAPARTRVANTPARKTPARSKPPAKPRVHRAAPAPAAPGGVTIRSVTFRTVPAIAGVRVLSHGRILRTDRHGLVTLRTRVTAGAPGERSRILAPPKVLPTRLPHGFEARFGGMFDWGRTIGLSLYTRLSLRFVDLKGTGIPAQQVREVRLRSSTGVRVTMQGDVTPELHASRVVRERAGVRFRPIEYAVERVDVQGGNVVHRSQQRFFPLRTRRLRVPLLLFSARFTSRDALLGYPAGSAVVLEYPSGQTLRIPLRDGNARVVGLPRGLYKVRVDAAGYSVERPVALSQNQLVDLKVVSYVDLTILFGSLGTVAIALVLMRRPLLRHRLRRVAALPARRARAVARR